MTRFIDTSYCLLNSRINVLQVYLNISFYIKLEKVYKNPRSFTKWQAQLTEPVMPVSIS